MKVCVPCDAIEARKATLAAAHVWGPVYLRFQREKTPVMTTDETPFIPGQSGDFLAIKETGSVDHWLRRIDYNALACRAGA